MLDYLWGNVKVPNELLIISNTQNQFYLMIIPFIYPHHTVTNALKKTLTGPDLFIQSLRNPKSVFSFVLCKF